MSIASRKEKEFKERESLILKTAFEILLTEGYMGLTIDKLAKKIDYAKGTVYKHFTCKEDIIVRILTDGFTKRQEIISRCFDLGLTERQVFFAGCIGAMLYNILNPNLHKVLLIARVGSIWNKVSDELKELHEEQVKDSYDRFDNLVNLAVNNGNLELGEHESVDIYYTIISLFVSYDGLIKGRKYSDMPPAIMSCFSNTKLVTHAKKMLSLNINSYLDGLNWRPLSSEFDYTAFEEKIVNTVYADLVNKVKKGQYSEFEIG